MIDVAVIAKPELFEIPIPDVSNLVTEDDTPVESIFSERQMHLLTDALYIHGRHRWKRAALLPWPMWRSMR